MADAESEALRLALPGGATLIAAGETSGMVYVLAAGRLAAVTADDPPRLLGLIWPGEAIGEISVLADIPHTATVVAVRDCELLALPREAFLAAVENHPSILIELMRTMIARARNERAAQRLAVTFGFLAACEGPPVRDFVERLRREVEGHGARTTLLTAEHLTRPTEWFSEREEEHDCVFYVAECGEAAWSAQCVRQADRVFFVGRGETTDIRCQSAAARTALKPADLVLIHPQECARPSGGRPWQEALGCRGVFHARDGDTADIARLARMITGRSVGVVLSGGGARGYAHVGALRALHERGVPIDFVGGASMGAVIAAGCAFEWDDAEMTARVRAAFVDTNPLSDLAVPLIALTRGHLVERRLFENFGDIDIRDLWRPYFCVSSDLTHGRHIVHDSGLLRRALRASIALPGILPPVVDGDTVLVDGGVMRNLPVEMMLDMHDGPIVAVDVSIDTGLCPKDIETPKSLLGWVLSGAWRKGAPIVSLLLRSATVTANRDVIAARGQADLFIAPELDGVEIRDWRAFEPAVEAGYRATIRALETLDGPLTELRLRRSP
ncbi:MAG TPA: patatin-like phospholipase family protein [Rhizomicrobium sp.]|nr:patatin-like phospholipase family protein [Rhizomicrobium sp.]